MFAATAETFKWPMSYWLALLCALVCSNGYALEVSPLVHEISSSGRGASSKVLVRNPSDASLPLEVQVHRIQFNADGSYQLKPEGDDLLVFPPALILNPGASQTLRLQWLGRADMERSQSYYVSLSQPPISLREPLNSGVRLALTFNILVHVSHPQLRPQLEVISVDLEREQELTMLRATLFNQGTGYSYLSDAKLSVTVSGSRVAQLQPGELRELGRDVFIAPGSQRSVLIPVKLKGEIWNGPIQLHIEPATTKGYW